MHAMQYNSSSVKIFVSYADGWMDTKTEMSAYVCKSPMFNSKIDCTLVAAACVFGIIVAVAVAFGYVQCKY